MVYGRNYNLYDRKKPVKVTRDELRLDLSRFTPDRKFKNYDYARDDFHNYSLKRRGSTPAYTDIGDYSQNSKKGKYENLRREEDIREKFKDLLSPGYSKNERKDQNIKDKFKDLLSNQNAKELERQDNLKEKLNDLISPKVKKSTKVRKLEEMSQITLRRITEILTQEKGFWMGMRMLER